MIFTIVYFGIALICFRPFAAHIAYSSASNYHGPAWGEGVVFGLCLASVWPAAVGFYGLQWWVRHSERLAVGKERQVVNRRRMLVAEQQARELARTVRDYEAGRI